MILRWYGHLHRMENTRWPKKIYLWTSHGRRRRGRPQQSWQNQVNDFMRSRNMEEDMAEDKTCSAFGSGWMPLSCIYRNNKINNILLLLLLLLLFLLEVV